MTPPVLTADQIAAIATREASEHTPECAFQSRTPQCVCGGRVPLTVAERDALVARIRELEAEVQSWISAIERAR